MHPLTPSLGEIRPTDEPTASGPPSPAVPLLALRGGRRVIPPEDCRLGPRCLVCTWRRAGLLGPQDADRPPDTEAA